MLGMLTGLGVLVAIAGAAGSGLYLVVSAFRDRRDAWVGLMAAAGTAAAVPAGFLIVAAGSTGLEPIVLPCVIAGLLLAVVAVRAALRTDGTRLRATSAIAVAAVAVALLGTLAAL